MSSLLNGRVRTHATRLSSACVEALVLAVRSARSRTVVILPGGMMEEYGPYLPSFTDGYINDTGELPNPHPLTEVERKEEGLSIHAGTFETSSILFLRPDLVGPIGQATPFARGQLQRHRRTGETTGLARLLRITQARDRRSGAHSLGEIKFQTDYALAILDGVDERQAKRIGTGAVDDVQRAALAYEAELERKQQAWLKTPPPK